MTLKKHVWPSICDLKLKHIYGMQQDNHLNAQSLPLIYNKIHTQSLDLNQIEMPCCDLKKAAHIPKDSLPRHPILKENIASYRHCKLIHVSFFSMCTTM